MTSHNDQDLVKRTIRIPKALNDEIQRAADEHHVSINTEMIERLQQASLADRHGELMSEIAELKAMVRRILAGIG